MIVPDSAESEPLTGQTTLLRSVGRRDTHHAAGSFLGRNV